MFHVIPCCEVRKHLIQEVSSSIADQFYWASKYHHDLLKQEGGGSIGIITDGDPSFHQVGGVVRRQDDIPTLLHTDG